MGFARDAPGRRAARGGDSARRRVRARLLRGVEAVARAPGIRFVPPGGDASAVPISDAWAYLGWNRRTLRLLGARPGRVPTARPLWEAERRVRDPFLEAIDALSRAAHTPDERLLPVLERNPYTSNLFLRLCLADAARALSAGGVEVVVDDAPLAAHLGLDVRPVPVRRAPGVRDFLRGFSAARRDARGVRPPPLPHGDCLIAFTLAEERYIDVDGRYRDLALGDVPERLAEGLPVLRVGHLTLGPARRAEILARGGGAWTVPEALWGLGDGLRAGLRAFRAARLPFRRVLVGGRDATDLVRREVEGRGGVSRCARGIAYGLLADRLKAAGVRVRLLVHTFENHVWERGLSLGIRRAFPGAEIVGYQHGNIPGMYLPYAIVTGDAPVLPDRILANAPEDAALLRACLPPGVPVEEGPAAPRFFRVDRRPAPEGPARVVVALPVGPADSAEALDRVARARPRGGADVVLCPNPMIPIEETVRAAGLDALPAGVRVAARGTAEELAEADRCLHANTSAGLLALRAGIPAYHLRLETWLELDCPRGAPGDRDVWDDAALARVLSAARGAVDIG